MGAIVNTRQFLVARQLNSAASAALGPSASGWTLGAQTYYVDCRYGGTDGALSQAFAIDWDATIVMTITPELTLRSDADISLANTRHWCPSNPPGASVDIVGGTASGSIVTVPGGTAGMCVFNFPDYGGIGVRLKLVVTTGGNANGCGGAKD